MKIKLITSFLVLGLLFFCNTLFSAEKILYYTSDNLNVEFDKSGEPYKLILSGNVKVVLDDINIICNEAIFNQSTGEINIEGVVDVETIEGTFRAENFFYNVYQEEGIMFNTVFKIPPLYGKAEKVERDKSTLFLYKGYITTCDKENPHYRLAVEKIKYVHNDYLRAKKMKLFLGEKFSIFYFPRITIDYKNKTSPFLISSGHTTRMGKTLEVLFNHKISETSDTYLTTKVNIGNKSIGAGPEVASESQNFKISTFFSYQRDKGEFEYGGFTELSKPFSFSSIPFNVIADWRWMYDKDFFYDFYRDIYHKKNRAYNHLSFTGNFKGGIFNIGIRDNAKEDFLKIEKIPEVRFYTPRFKISESPFFIENDLRVTNFYKEKEYTLRSVDTLTLSTPNYVGNFLFSPYFSLSGVDYRNSVNNKFNVMYETGVNTSTILKKEGNNFKEYLKPTFSLFYRGLRYKKEKLEYFDRIEDMDDGIFAGVDIDWSLWKKDEYIGSISLENLYNVDRYNFEETFFKYDIKVTDKIHLSGMNEWNLGERKYLFGVNDFNYNSSRYQYSLGTRYDNVGNVSGIAGSFQHNVNDLWSYSTSVCYDIDKGSFNQKSFELWKKLHCWELRLKIKKNTDDFSFYIFASPIFL